MGEPKRTRLIFLGFPDQAPAEAVVDVIMAGRESKAIVVEDMVLVHKAIGGKVTVEGMKSADPGAARGRRSGARWGRSWPSSRAPSASGRSWVAPRSARSRRPSRTAASRTTTSTRCPGSWPTAGRG